MDATTKKPTYLGLLNAISLGETEAGIYLRAWADATSDEALACTLRLVAARETSHGQLFCRMLNELGYELRHKPNPEAAARVARYGNPKISDLDKIGAARREVDSNPFAAIERRMAAGEFDPVTHNMLSWYICEERDSGKKLRAAYDKVRAAGSAKANGHDVAHSNGGAPVPSAEAQAIMACITDGFSRLEKSLERVAGRA